MFSIDENGRSAASFGARHSETRADRIVIFFGKRAGHASTTKGVVDGGAATYPVVGLTLRDRVVAAIQAAGATEEMVDGAVGVFGEFGDSPPSRGGRPRKYAEIILHR